MSAAAIVIAICAVLTVYRTYFPLPPPPVELETLGEKMESFGGDLHHLEARVALLEPEVVPNFVLLFISSTTLPPPSPPRLSEFTMPSPTELITSVAMTVMAIYAVLMVYRTYFSPSSSGAGRAENLGREVQPPFPPPPFPWKYHLADSETF